MDEHQLARSYLHIKGIRRENYLQTTRLNWLRFIGWRQVLADAGVLHSRQHNQVPANPRRGDRHGEGGRTDEVAQPAGDEGRTQPTEPATRSGATAGKRRQSQQLPEPRPRESPGQFQPESEQQETKSLSSHLGYS